jgi:hypothetical protein
LANEKLLPQSVINQHKLSIEEWEEKVSSTFLLKFINDSSSFEDFVVCYEEPSVLN